MITKTVLEQYEKIRLNGTCNMFDYYCVIKTADRFNMYGLACLSKIEYQNLLLNFDKYMFEFEVKQS